MGLNAGQAGDSPQSGVARRSHFLWDHAYKKLEGKDPELVKQYRILIIRILKEPKGASPNKLDSDKIINIEEVSSQQIKWAVECGLERTQDLEDAVRRAAGIADAILSVKDLITQVLTAFPTGRCSMDRDDLGPIGQSNNTGEDCCLGSPSNLLQGLSNAAAQATINREGVRYLCSLVRWYCKFFDEMEKDGNKEDEESLYRQLESFFIDLYQMMTEYQMRSVVLYYRNWFSRAIRGAFKIEPWEQLLVDIRLQEEFLRRRVEDQYRQATGSSLLRIVAGIGEIVEGLRTSRRRTTTELIGDFSPEGLNYNDFMDDIPKIKKGTPEEIGTCDWFLENATFKTWTSGLLLIQALPGQGKSVLARFLVETLRATEESTTVCQFFFSHDNQVQQSAANGLCAVLHQLFEKHDYAAGNEEVRVLIGQGGDALFSSTSRLWNVLKLVLQVIDNPVIIIFDALDECGDEDRTKLLVVLQTFCQNVTPKAKILATSQPTNQVEKYLDGTKLQSGFLVVDLNLELELPRVIERVIHDQVQNLGKIHGWDEMFQGEVEKELKGDGQQLTFLWLRLIFKLMNPDKKVTYSNPQWINLIRSSSGVNDTYASLLREIDKVAFGDAKLLFSLLIAAREPLAPAEINYALKVLQGGGIDEKYMPSEIRMVEWIKRNTGLLTVIKSGHVHLLHQTAREYFTRPEIASADPATTVSDAEAIRMSFTTEAEAHERLRLICLRWLQHHTAQWIREKADRDSGQGEPEGTAIKEVPVSELQNGFLDYALKNYAFHFDKSKRELKLYESCYESNSELAYPFEAGSGMPGMATLTSGDSDRFLSAVRMQHFVWQKVKSMAKTEKLDGDIRGARGILRGSPWADGRCHHGAHRGTRCPGGGNLGRTWRGADSKSIEISSVARDSSWHPRWSTARAEEKSQATSSTPCSSNTRAPRQIALSKRSRTSRRI